MTRSRALAAESLFAFNLCVVLAGQEAPWTTPTAAQIEAVYPAIEALYIDLHKNPELAFQETQTAAKLAAHVKTLGFEHAERVSEREREATAAMDRALNRPGFDRGSG